MDFYCFHTYNRYPEEIVNNGFYSNTIAVAKEKGMGHLEFWMGEGGHASWHPVYHGACKGGGGSEHRQAVWQLRRFLLDFKVGLKLTSQFQIADMMEFLGDEYAWIGRNISGDDNNKSRHFNPIFYRKDRLEPLEHSTVWLSDWIGVPGYGAWSARLFTWVKFRDKKTDKIFYFFNGHYDHMGYEARINSSYIVRDMVARIAKGMPAFVTADYNSSRGTMPYVALENSAFLKNSKDAVSEPTNGQYSSCPHYVSTLTKPANGYQIDHIFYTPNAVRVQHWEMIIKDYHGKFGSDHLPIFIDCRIAN